MKIKDGFILKEVAGNYVVIALEDTLDFNKVVTVNETGSFIWDKILKESTREEIISDISKEYGIDENTAASDFDDFVNSLHTAGILEK